MNIMQYFHKREFPPFNIGDEVRLKDDLTGLFPLHPKMDKEKLKQVHKNLEEYLGLGVHRVSKIEPGTPEAGGWFVYVDGIDQGYHGNLFEIVYNKITMKAI